MTKKRAKLGDASKELFAPKDRTGAEALDILANTPRRGETPARAAPDAAPVRFVVTNFRITEADVAALQREAVERKIQRGYGKADASEVIRELLAAWRFSRGRRP